MDEPQEVTDRRLRRNLIAAVRSIAEATELRDLHTELIGSFFDSISDDCEMYGAGAMSAEERAAAVDLCKAINALLEKGPWVLRGLIGRRVRKPLTAEDFVELGWLREVQPRARIAFSVFMRRGWLDRGL